MAQLYENVFLVVNKSQRMDANRVGIFNSKRAAFHKDRYKFASQYIENKEVIDVASGLGYGADLMIKQGKARKITGVEISIKAVEYAKANYSVDGKIQFIFRAVKPLASAMGI